MLAWLNHAALNLGSALACLWYAVIPPQWTGHSSEDVRDLGKTNPVKAFWDGLTS